MKKTGEKFASLEEADEAEHQYYRNLTPDARVEILLELVARYWSGADGTSEGFEKVFRLAPLEES